MILSGHQHEARAQALATAYGENAAAISGLSRGSNGIVAVECSDSTLSIWGHGDAERFADLLDVECGLLIANWKLKNPSLKTVELITCDAQHHSKPLSGYAQRVLKFTLDRGANIVIKALPAGQHSDDRSILWANAGTSTFCYITASSQTAFTHANQRMVVIDQANGGNCALAAAELAKERTLAEPNNFTVTGGIFANLRATLATVKASQLGVG